MREVPEIPRGVEIRALGIDWGEKFVGLAFWSSEAKVPVPLRTVPTSKAAEEIVKLCKERRVTHIFLGLPLALDGSPTRVTEEVKRFASSLKASLKASFLSDTPELIYVDERMSSSFVEKMVRSWEGSKGEKSGRKRRKKGKVKAWRQEKHSLEALEILEMGISQLLKASQ